MFCFLRLRHPPRSPLFPSTPLFRSLDDYRQKVLRSARRGTVYPYELTAMLGDFTEYDLDDRNVLVPVDRPKGRNTPARSEEHTSELQSRQYLVCRLLLEKKNTHLSH